jgi:hypothetical protein
LSPIVHRLIFVFIYAADRVTLTLAYHMTTWSLPPGDNCSEHFYLNVRDGREADSPVIGHYCTNQVPPSVTSSVSKI